LILLQTSTSTQFSGTINILCKFIAKYPLLTFYRWQSNRAAIFLCSSVEVFNLQSLIL
jgi:hypothetical protein